MAPTALPNYEAILIAENRTMVSSSVQPSLAATRLAVRLEPAVVQVMQMPLMPRVVTYRSR